MTLSTKEINPVTVSIVELHLAEGISQLVSIKFSLISTCWKGIG